MVIAAAIVGLLSVGAITGALHGTVGGVLVAVGFGAVGALVWRADSLPWRDIASWTIPLTAWIAVAWFALSSEVAYLAAGAVAIVWLASFIFWLVPVRWWYRWVLRKGLPYGNRSRGAAQLHELDLAIGQALRQYGRDADASVLHQRSKELLSRAVALPADDPGTNEARALLVSYLGSLRSITADPWAQPPTSFKALDDQIRAFREALRGSGGASA